MEEMEVPTEHLHEAIEEKAREAAESIERKGSLYIAISTALMAVFAALASLMAGHHSDEALIAQIKASDQWSYYEAKGIKGEIASLLAAKSTNGSGSAALGADTLAARYKREQADIQKTAKGYEDESEAHLAHHHVLAAAVTLFQISIAISAIAILTRRRALWWAGIVLSGVGLVFFCLGML